MKNNFISGFLSCLVMVACFYLINKYGLKFNDIISALQLFIAAFVAFIAYQYNNNYKNQKELQIMIMKRENYSKFLEAFMKKISYNHPQIVNSIEAANANKDFCVEYSKLGVYASDEVIEFCAEVQCGNTSKSPKELINLIRKDLNMKQLSNSEYCPQTPNSVVITGSDGKISVFTKQ